MTRAIKRPVQHRTVAVASTADRVRRPEEEVAAVKVTCKNVTFLNPSYVCAEPVLANDLVLVQNGTEKRTFLHRARSSAGR